MEGLILQDETLLETMQSYMDASLISLIEDFGEVSWGRAWSSSDRLLAWGVLSSVFGVVSEMALFSQMPNSGLKEPLKEFFKNVYYYFFKWC